MQRPVPPRIRPYLPLIVLGLLAAPSATKAQTTCLGLEATIVGTEERDILLGTSGDDVIVALAGDDFILGGRGNDVICAGDGRDIVLAGSGSDVVVGGPGRDLILGGADDDELDGGDGDDGIFGGRGFDVCVRGRTLACEVTDADRPTANAGADQTVLVGANVQLDGSASTDPQGDSLSFLWAFVSVPPSSTAALSDATAVMPTFAVDVPGTYVAALVVRDGALESVPDTVEITTENSPPVADAGPDQTALVGDTVILNASGSFDVDGDPISYSWTLVTRPPESTTTLSDPTAVMPTFLVDAPGTYVAELVANDGAADGPPDRVQITTENSPPVAEAGVDQTAFVGDDVTLDGSASTDVDGDALTFAWSLTSMPIGSTATLDDPSGVMPTFTVDVFGTYVAQLVVHDGTVASPPDTVAIATLNSPPVADAGKDQTVFVGDTAFLDGSGSSDVDGDPLKFAWSLTSVPRGSAAVISDPKAIAPSFDVDVPGTYVAQLIVHDGTVASAPDTVSVTTLNSPPVADAGTDRSVATGAKVTLDGSGSSDADGDPLSFDWALTTRPADSSAILSGAATASPTFVADSPGLYVAQLIVNDGRVDSAPDTVRIVAESAPTAILRVLDQSGQPTSQIPFGDTFILDGSLSSDSDGAIEQYTWRYMNPSTVTAEGGVGTTTTVTLDDLLQGPVVTQDAQLVVQQGNNKLALGEHRFELRVTNDSGNESLAAVVSLFVIDAQAPTAILRTLSAQGQPTSQIPFGDTFILDGSLSSDSGGGAIVSYTWRYLNPSTVAAEGGIGTTTTVTLDALLQGPVVTQDAQLVVQQGNNKLALGEHRFELRVTDDSGNESLAAVVSLFVIDALAPTAVLRILDASGQPFPLNQMPLGATFMLDGTKSADSGGGSVVQYRWRHVSGGVLASSSTTLATTVTLDDLLAGPIVTQDPQLVVRQDKARLATGTHEFGLIVADDSGNVSKETIVQAEVTRVVLP